MSREVNWAGNYTYRAIQIHRPRSVPELQQLVARSERIRALGTRHCFNDIADSAEMVSLADIDPGIEIDRDAMTASVSAGTRYGVFFQEVERNGLALHNTGSLPHISVGGATATATHGSGDSLKNLSSAVSGIELVTSDGELRRFNRGDPDFPGMVVHLGALGIVSRLTFDVQPTFQACQEVWEDLSLDVVEAEFDQIFSCAYSVSVFTQYRDQPAVLWIKHRLEPGAEPVSANRWCSIPASVDRHPMDELSGDACTTQLLNPGPWCERLPHFRLDQIPASGEEIQSEYMVDRSRAVDAIRALRAFEPEMRESMMIAEIRTVAADDLWMSTAYGRDTVAFHFSWYRDQAKVDALLPKLEAALAPFDPRPHWGKTFAFTARDLEAKYPRMDEFRGLMAKLDPRGTFHNDFLRERILGQAD